MEIVYSYTNHVPYGGKIVMHLHVRESPHDAWIYSHLQHVLNQPQICGMLYSKPGVNDVELNVRAVAQSRITYTLSTWLQNCWTQFPICMYWCCNSSTVVSCTVSDCELVKVAFLLYVPLPLRCTTCTCIVAVDVIPYCLSQQRTPTTPQLKAPPLTPPSWCGWEWYVKVGRWSSQNSYFLNHISTANEMQIISMMMLENVKSTVGANLRIKIHICSGG